MSTISFSIEEEAKQDFAVCAKRARKTKSDLFRDMLAVYKFNQQLAEQTSITETALKELGIGSETELYDYLDSDETYQSRI